jgi:hypothetical protein
MATLESEIDRSRGRIGDVTDSMSLSLSLSTMPVLKKTAGLICSSVAVYLRTHHSHCSLLFVSYNTRLLPTRACAQFRMLGSLANGLN